MTVNKNNKIVAFVGLAGSGKTEAYKYVVGKGYPKVYFGGVILDQMTREGIELTEENEKKYREEIRAKHGNDYVVKQIIPQIHDLFNAGQHRVVADGVYTWTEYKALKREFPGELVVVAMVAPKHLRHRRLLNREVRPLTQADADSRDWAEIENLEKGGPIAIADYYIANDSHLENMYKQIDKLMTDIEFYDK